MKIHRITTLIAALCAASLTGHAVTVQSDGADVEVRSNSTTAYIGGADIRVGGSGSGYDGAAIFVFQLPSLSGSQIVTDASLSFELFQIANSFAFDADLYGLPYDTSTSISASDYYGGSYDGDSGATALQEDIMTDSMSLGTVTTSSGGNSALVDYLNAQYTAGAEGGDYVFIRVNVDTTDASDYRYYRIGSGNNSGNEPELTITLGDPPDTTAPSTPTGLATSDVTTTSVDLTWNASTDNVGVAGYKVYTNGSSPVSVTTIGTSITGLTQNTSYTFTVTAYDAASNESSASSGLAVTTDDGAAPTTPTNLAYSNLGTTSVDLSWTASTDNVGVAGYNVYTYGSNPLVVAGTSVTVTNLSPETEYDFTVSAFDAADNESSQTSAVTVTTESSGGDGSFISEDFSSSADNFTVLAGGTWGLSGGRYALTSPASGGAGLLGNISVHDTVLVGDYQLTALVRIVGTGSDWDDSAVIFDLQDIDNFYYVSLNESNDSNTKGVFKVVDGTPAELFDLGSVSVSSDTDYDIEIQRSGTSINVWLDGTLVANLSDSTFVGGQVGFGSKNDSGQFDDLVVSAGALIDEDFTSSAANFTEEAGGTWSVSSGRYTLSSPANAGTGLLGNISVHNTVVDGDFSILATVRIIGNVEVWNDCAVVFDYQDEDNYYYVSLNESNDANTMGLMLVENGSATQLADITTTVYSDTDYSLQIDRTGSGISVWLDSSLVATATDSTFSSGLVGFGSKNDSAEFDNLLVFGDAGTATTVTPSFSPAAGTYSSAQNVTISTATGGATIRYTTDGSTPTSTTGTVYSIPVSVTATTTLKAIAYMSGLFDSAVVSGTFTISATQVDDPVFSPSGGTFTSGQNVSISTTTSGASIRYTTDGSTPTSTTGTVYSGAISVSSSTTLKAIAYKSGMTDSNVTSANYVITTASTDTPEMKGIVGDWAFIPNIIAADYSPPTHNKTATPANVVSQIAGLQSGDVLLLEDGDYSSISIEVLNQSFGSTTQIVAESYAGTNFATFAAYGSSNLVLRGIQANSFVFNRCSNCEWHYLKANYMRYDINGRNGYLDYSGGRASTLNSNMLVNKCIADRGWPSGALGGQNTAEIGYTDGLDIVDSMFIRASADNFKLRGWENSTILRSLFWGSQVETQYGGASGIHNDALQGEGYSGYENDNVTITYSAAIGLNTSGYQGSQGFFITGGTNSNFLVEQCMSFPTQNSNGFAFASSHTNSSIINCSGIKSTFRVSGSSNEVINCAGQMIWVDSGAPQSSGNLFYNWGSITSVFEDTDGTEVDSFKLQPGLDQQKGAYDLLSLILARRAAWEAAQ